jgi:hypothetical protein
VKVAIASFACLPTLQPMSKYLEQEPLDKSRYTTFDVGLIRSVTNVSKSGPRVGVGITTPVMHGQINQPKELKLGFRRKIFSELRDLFLDRTSQLINHHFNRAF